MILSFHIRIFQPKEYHIGSRNFMAGTIQKINNMIYGMQFEPKLLLLNEKKKKEIFIQIIFPIYVYKFGFQWSSLFGIQACYIVVTMQFVYGRCPHVSSSFIEAGCIVLHVVNWIKHHKLHDVIWELSSWKSSSYIVHQPLEMPKSRVI